MERSPCGLMRLLRALRRLLALALPPLLAVVLTLTPLPPPWPNRLLPGMLQPAQAWDLPRWGEQERSTSANGPLKPSAPTGRLQEVSPPEAVQQLQSALADRLPQVLIESPRDGALLPDGTWQLKLKVRDWPLTDAGRLGLGAHLVVQLDDLPPQRLTGATRSNSGQGDRATSLSLVVDEPALTPGSHRLTVYAARPWGEAVKSPGAVCQITVNRVLANPSSQPQAGSPQLLAVSPADLGANEPLLLDWILLDAPLQNLRDGDGSWRLRVTINGDRFLMDQNVPLWLRGWKPGRNSLQLELLDGLGQPLNPPFNSLVQEVTLNPPGSGGASQPRWLQGRLSADELAQLLGDRPAEDSADEQDADTAVEPDQGPSSPLSRQALTPEDLEKNPDGKQQEAEPEPEPGPGPEPEAAVSEPEADAAEAGPAQQPQDLLLDDQVPSAMPQEAPMPDNDDRRTAPVESPPEPTSGDPLPDHPDPTTTPELIVGPLQEPRDLETPSDETAPEVDLGETSPMQEPPDGSSVDATKWGGTVTGEQPLDEEPHADFSMSEVSPAEDSLEEDSSEEDSSEEDSRAQQPALEDQLSMDQEPVASISSTPQRNGQGIPVFMPAEPPLEIVPPQRISSGTALGAPARQQVNARGELIREAPTGPLAGLRQLLLGS
ncbi:MAG: hypothetical protein KGO47_06895 [Cyanobacteria bacterium REEB417]|nr:hypothetical protein [Cyanobacteria bacterium REEB417]